MVLALFFGAFFWAVGTSALALALISLAGFVLPFAALVWASTTVTGEKESHTWDLLRITPITASDFVVQSVDGITARLNAIWLTLFPGVVILLGSQPHGGVLPIIAWTMARYLIYHCAISGVYSSVISRSALASVASASVFFLTRLLVLVPLSWALMVACVFSGWNSASGLLIYPSGDLCALFSSLCFCAIFFVLAVTVFWTYSVRYHVQTVETLVKHEGFERADTTSYND